MPTQTQLDDYFKRSGDTELSEGNIFENSYGFCIWRTYEDVFVLVHVYGDGNYWNNWAEIKAKEFGMKKIIFGTKRNPSGFCRKHGFHISGYVLERSI